MDELILNFVGNFGALGLIFWLVWRTNSYTLPKIIADFEKSVTEARTDYKEMLTAERDDFKNILDDQRVFFEKQLSKLLDAVTCRPNSSRTSTTPESASSRK